MCAKDLLRQLLEQETLSLAAFNVHCIESVAGAIGLDCTFVRQSQLEVDGTSTQLLKNLTLAVDCDTYLSGGGAGGYLDEAVFGEDDVSLCYQGFEPQSYGDPGRFMPGLSVIDLLMSVGIAGAQEHLR